MKKTTSYLLLLCMGFALNYGCKKSKNTVSASQQFADSLRKNCTTPFVGHGDSSDIHLPTAFTPNGDGVNDIYDIQGKSCLTPGYFSNFQMTIYDTTGTLVFQAKDVADAMWDGMDIATGRQSTKYKFYVKINYTTAGNIRDSGGTFLFLLSTNTGSGCVNAVAADSAKYEFPDQVNAVTGYNPAWSSGETYCR